jgi:hypothetical protein
MTKPCLISLHTGGIKSCILFEYAPKTLFLILKTYKYLTKILCICFLDAIAH